MGPPVCPPWFAPETPINSLERNFRRRYLCAANGQSHTCRGTIDVFLDLSDQEHHPRDHIRFAVADVRRPIISLSEASASAKRQAKEPSVEGGVSVRCITTNGLDFLRARSFLSEFRTVGEGSVDTAIVAAGIGRHSDNVYTHGHQDREALGTPFVRQLFVRSTSPASLVRTDRE